MKSFTYYLIGIVLLTGCYKQPEDLDPISDHPEYIGNWIIRAGYFKERADVEFPPYREYRLTIKENGSATMKQFGVDFGGEIGFRGNKFYIIGREFEVIEAPTKLEWITQKSRTATRPFNSHRLRFQETTKGSSDDAPTTGYEILLDETDPLAFFGKDSILLNGSKDGFTIRLEAPAEDSTQGSILFINDHNDSLFIPLEEAEDRRFFKDGDTLQVGIRNMYALKISSIEDGYVVSCLAFGQNESYTQSKDSVLVKGINVLP